MNRRIKDELGNRYGQLIVQRFAGINGHQAWWLCECTCGKDSVVRSGSLRSGNTTSCGCTSKVIPEVARSVRKQATGGHIRIVNGKDVRSAEYRCWRHIKSRCYNPNVPTFNDYGGRGLTVCSQWLQSFPTFLSDMGPKPSPKHSLDRINNDDGYHPANCRWATRTEQARNRRPRRKKTPLTSAATA